MSEFYCETSFIAVPRSRGKISNQNQCLLKHACAILLGSLCKRVPEQERMNIGISGRPARVIGIKLMIIVSSLDHIDAEFFGYDVRHLIGCRIGASGFGVYQA